MRIERLLPVVILACLLATAGCGADEVNEPPPASPACEAGESGPCYAGPDGTAGIGPCRAGVQVCEGSGADAAFGACAGEVLPGTELCNGLDDDCDGERDEGLQNACGGCAELTGRRDAACGTCGTLICAGTEALVCDDPPTCGGCGQDTPGFGDPCLSAEGCTGSQVCQGAALFCEAPGKNECGACGGPAVPGLGAPCNDGTCDGLTVCDATGTGSRCEVEQPNACGFCAPVSQNPGQPCTDAAGCAGTWDCGAAAMECARGAGVTPNACGVCVQPGQEVGDACVDACCSGLWACGAAAGTMTCAVDPAVCNPPSGAVLISEVSVAGPLGASDEFVELYNAGAAPVDLGSWAIHFRGGGASISKLNLSGVIPAHGFFLFSHPTYVGPPAADLTRASLTLVAGGGTVGITDHQTAIADFSGCVDHVAWGAGNDPECTAAPAPASGGSIERKASSASTPESMAAGGADAGAGNGRDTNNNAADFVVQAARAPQNAASAPEP